MSCVSSELRNVSTSASNEKQYIALEIPIALCVKPIVRLYSQYSELSELQRAGDPLGAEPTDCCRVLGRCRIRCWRDCVLWRLRTVT
jgi:hypothetical protein